MKMERRVTVNPDDPSEALLDKAVALLRNGGIVVYPTDTTYALGANALDTFAVEQVSRIKARVKAKPYHVVIPSLDVARHFVFVDEFAERLGTAFLPGPLTMVLAKRDGILDACAAGGSTLGIRIPNNKICVALACKAQVPLTTTSANASGGANCYSIDEVIVELQDSMKSIDLFIDQGPLEPRPPSTIVDLTVFPPRILREGGIPGELIIKMLS